MKKTTNFPNIIFSENSNDSGKRIVSKIKKFENGFELQDNNQKERKILFTYNSELINQHGINDLNYHFNNSQIIKQLLVKFEHLLRVLIEIKLNEIYESVKSKKTEENIAFLNDKVSFYTNEILKDKNSDTLYSMFFNLLNYSELLEVEDAEILLDSNDEVKELVNRIKHKIQINSFYTIKLQLTELKKEIIFDKKKAEKEVLEFFTIKNYSVNKDKVKKILSILQAKFNFIDVYNNSIDEVLDILNQKPFNTIENRIKAGCNSEIFSTILYYIGERIINCEIEDIANSNLFLTQKGNVLTYDNLRKSKNNYKKNGDIEAIKNIILL